jgi:hypothetical protein
MNIDENEESQNKPIQLKDNEALNEKKEDIITDLVYIPKFNYLNGRKTYWSQDLELDLILNQYKKIHILDKNSLKRAKWSSEEDKVFTPSPVVSIPKNIDINTFENLLRKKKLAEIEKKISTGNFLDEEIDNDKDLRSPSPEPIYDPRSGQRINTREMRNKEKFLKQKNSLIAELIQFDEDYIPPHGYKPPKLTHKIYIINNEKYLFTRYILGNKGENLKHIQNISKCKISIKGEGGGWINTNNPAHNSSKPKEALHLLIESDNEETLKKGIEIILPYLNEKSEEYKKAKTALITQINVNNNEWSCEICGEKGHKSWACPLNINQYKAEVVCQYCGDKGHPSMDCPFLESLKNKNLEESKNKKDPKDVQNSILIKGINKSNLMKEDKSMNINNDKNNLFGEYEETLMNNYAKFLAVNANKNKILQKKYYRNPSSQENGRAFEGEAVNYNYFGTIQEKLINSNLDDNKKDK